MRLCLAGLEDFSNCDSVVDYIAKFLVLDRALYAEVLNRGTEQDVQFATVIFYDVQGPDDVNLNAEFSKHILEHIVVAPKLTVVSIIFVFYS